MSNYKRLKSEGGTFFFTVVTYKRQPVFDIPEYIKYLRASINETRRSYPFHIDAWVLLPEHMHCIWTLPENDYDYSRRWGLIKSRFTKRARDILPESTNSLSRIKHREASVWQRRFWEHEIRKISITISIISITILSSTLMLKECRIGLSPHFTAM